MLITLKINDNVPVDEVAYILRCLVRDIEDSGISSYSGRKRSGVRVFDSNGDPVGEVKFDMSSTIPELFPESPIEA